MRPIIKINSEKFLVPYLFDNGYMVVTRNHPGQMFSFVEEKTGEQRHYDVSRLRDFISADPKAIEIGCVPIASTDAEYILYSSGIEESRLKRLTPEQLDEPGIMVHFADGTDIIVDGNHRFVQRFFSGKTDMLFYILSEAQAKPALLDLPEDHGFNLAMAGRETR